MSESVDIEITTLRERTYLSVLVVSIGIERMLVLNMLYFRSLLSVEETGVDT